ncbi:MAG: uncharacterized protein PWR22_922 [Moorella sp. (in: firmicutes)]|uniref:DUF401 family protein n=1 Tax=Moorella sp. E308F TaxID=2572682 RepID=UPI0010FFAFC6|nr:DUF401 family protein [Moorella sp. E308F]MDK2816293.1 uncharacterized protein [Moorella sp. (in: firmicutes)]MDK2895251.1 uncharacterized protein [Moorella sp. (in: firmicutes)]GEA14118.1 hypothetical protein E308F_03590 [Moorella sp. E308F]
MEGLKLLLVFGIMMVLLGRRAPLGPVMLGSSLLLAALYHIGPVAFLGMAWQATRSPATLELEVILALIMLFEHLLGEQGYLERMLQGLRGLIRNRRLVMALLPAFIGLMPSAGGALFSAPLVGQAAARTAIAAEEKSFINYYYRHIWEYFLPLYPGVLLASRLSGIPLPHLIAALAPYGLLVILLGIPALRRVKIEPEGEGREGLPAGRRTLARELFLSILPVLVVVALVLVFHVEVGLAVGVVLLFLLVRHRYTPLKFWHLCREAIAVKTLLLVWGVMLFKEVLVDTRAVDGLPSLLAMLPVPEFLIFGLISFLVGMLTGLTVAYVGIAFPIVMTAVGGQISLPLAVFIFVAGFTGNMLTPMHLCLALTVDFFKADLRKVLRMMVGPEAALLAVAVAAYLAF